MAAVVVAPDARGRVRPPRDLAQPRTERSHGSHIPLGMRPCDRASGAGTWCYGKRVKGATREADRGGFIYSSARTSAAVFSAGIAGALRRKFCGRRGCRVAGTAVSDYPHRPRVLLATLSQRTSSKGRAYLSGYLGKAKVLGFEGDADKWGNPTWDLYVSEPEPRDGDSPTNGRRAPQPHQIGR